MQGCKMKRIRLGRYIVPVWLLEVLLFSGIGATVLASYVWYTVNIPIEAKEPLELLHYPSQFSFYPGEKVDFNVTLKNSASVSYAVILNFRLNNSTYQDNYVTFSDDIYVVAPGQHDLTAWLKLKADAPPMNDSLTISFSRADSAIVGWKFGEGNWKVDVNGGCYSVQDGILTLNSTSDQSNYICIYKPISVSDNFTIYYEVKADKLGGFCLKLAKSQPFFSSTSCIAFETMHPQGQGKGFEIARWVNSWSWNTFAQPKENVWYQIEIEVHKTPFEVVYTVFNGSEILGSARANDMTNIGFDDLHYVVFECFAGECQYEVRNFSLDYQ